MPALLKKKHRKPQWTSKKFTSKIIGAELQFNKFNSTCAGVLSLWHAWSQCKPQCSDAGPGLLEIRDSVIGEGEDDQGIPSISGPVLMNY